MRLFERQTAQEFGNPIAVPLHFGDGPLRRVVDPAGQPQLSREAVDVGTETHSLHGPADLHTQPHFLSHGERRRHSRWVGRIQ
jgi:hypothetical protein